MKYCPSCLNQYTDLTLKFCLQDGTPLSAMPQKAERPQSTIDTVAFSQPVTAASFLPNTSDFKVEQPPQNRTQQHNIRPEAVKKAKRSNKALVALAVLVPVVTLSGAGAASAWYLLRDRVNSMSRQQQDAPQAEPATPVSSPAVPETVKANDAPASTSTDPEALKAEITGLVDQWRSLIEGRNAEKLSQMYGEKVDYLEASGIANAEIRSRLQKLFDAYSDIDLELTNLSVAVDPEGKAATAVFDNEWDYEASPKLASGKAHTKLHFERGESGWKIVSERQLKIYYKEN